MEYRRLGKSDLKVSLLGMGCWAIGGPWTFADHPAGWGRVDDHESRRALQVALDKGINFFDTAANYGCGHSERLVGQVMKKVRTQVIIATKFGYLVDEKKKIVSASDDVVGRLRQDCLDSLRRLDSDYIDLYQFHVNDYPAEKAGEVRDALESLVAEGLIRWYGWSTDHVGSARVFAQGAHCTAIQHILNMGRDTPEMLALCAEADMASVNRTPLGMGILTGKFTAKSTFPADDVRSGWSFYQGWQAERLKQIEAAHQVLTRNGHSLAQAALAWIWTRSPLTVPIPGFKSIAQVEENISAVERGLLDAEQMEYLEGLFRPV